MKPADVPDNLLETLLHAADDVCVEMPPFEAARILCELLPAHERMVRDQVAAEIEEDADELDRQKVKSGAAYVRRAARRVRGENR